MIDDGPVLDTRPPGYGNGPSFGMLGPSRLVVSIANLPPALAFLAGGAVLGYRLQQFGGSPHFFAQWRGTWASVQVSVFFSLVFPLVGTWRWNMDLNSSPPTHSGSSFVQGYNFVWVNSPIELTTGSPYAGTTIHRVQEWQTITERFPAAAFPDSV